MPTDPTTQKATVTIRNRMGLHARPAVVFVELANKYNASVVIRNGDQAVDGKSIMQIMMLAAVQGTELEIETDGPDAESLMAELTDLVNRKFDEE